MTWLGRSLGRKTSIKITLQNLYPLPKRSRLILQLRYSFSLLRLVSLDRFLCFRERNSDRRVAYLVLNWFVFIKDEFELDRYIVEVRLFVLKCSVQGQCWCHLLWWYHVAGGRLGQTFICRSMRSRQDIPTSSSPSAGACAPTHT